MATDYEFSTVDFGWDNLDSDYFRSFIQVIPGPWETARSRFSFPSVDAEFVQSLGNRGRTNVWLVDMVAKAYSYLVTFQDDMEAVQIATTIASLKERGYTYTRAYCQSFEYMGPVTPLHTPWAFASRYQIRWRILI